MLVAGVDFEATGADTSTSRITEIGAVIWDSETWEVKEEFSRLVYDDDYPELTPEIIDITGITLGMLQKKGAAMEPTIALDEFLHFIGRAKYVIAHNINYDAKLLQSELLRHEFDISIPEKKWLCSYLHVPYPAKYRCKQLSHLLLDHGEMVDPSKSHRALDDVKMIGRLLARGGYSLESIITYRDEPWVYLQAIIPPPWEDEGKGKAQAQKEGYSYQQVQGKVGPEFPKCWVKRVKISQLENEQKTSTPFKRSIIFRDKIESNNK